MHLTPPSVERQQSLQGVEIVALNEHVPCVAFPDRVLCDILKQTICHPARCADVVLPRQPIQGRHSYPLLSQPHKATGVPFATVNGPLGPSGARLPFAADNL